MGGCNSSVDHVLSPCSGRRDSIVRKRPHRVVGGLRLPSHVAGQRGPPPEDFECTRLSGQIGGGNEGSGRVRPHLFSLPRSIEEGQSPDPSPVEERVTSTRIFIERAKERIGCCREDVIQAQEAVAKAQSKLSEEQASADGEARLVALVPESEGLREEVPPTMPANFPHVLAELRACVQELRRENSQLRSELQAGGRDCEERTLAGQESVEFHTRFGPSQLESRGSTRTRSVSEPAHFEWGTDRSISQDGDNDRQRRRQFAFESHQSLVGLMGIPRGL